MVALPVCFDSDQDAYNDSRFKQKLLIRELTPNMQLPQRVKQHKAQSDSFAILLYRLRDLGIFRNVTENDYGIDFEVEIVADQMVLGRFFKAQVKSSESLYIRRKDKAAVVRGIKETTLNYWREISARSNVIVFAVDLRNEDIYYSTNLAEQVRDLYDGTSRSKSIVLSERIARESPLASHQHKLVSATIRPTISETTAYHRIALTELTRFSELFLACQRPWDKGAELHDTGTLKIFLDTCKVLVGLRPIEEKIKADGYNAGMFYDFPYWQSRSLQEGYDNIKPAYETVRYPVTLLFPELIERLNALKAFVDRSKIYWRETDQEYLKTTVFTEIPTDLSQDGLNHSLQRGLYRPSIEQLFGLIAAVDTVLGRSCSEYIEHAIADHGMNARSKAEERQTGRRDQLIGLEDFRLWEE